MKPVYILLIGILALGLFVVVTGCTGYSDQKLNIRIDDKIIKSVKLDFDDEIDIFKEAFNSEDLLAAEFVEFGEKVYFDFSAKMPDKIEIWDSILTPEGDYMYDEKSSIVITCERDKAGYYFIVKKHPASGFSSIHEDGKVDLRGYSVKISWNDSGDVVYGFVIKTDGGQ